MVKIISVQNNMEAAVLRFVVMAIATHCLTRPALRVIALQTTKPASVSTQKYINFCDSDILDVNYGNFQFYNKYYYCGRIQTVNVTYFCRPHEAAAA